MFQKSDVPLYSIVTFDLSWFTEDEVFKVIRRSKNSVTVESANGIGTVPYEKICTVVSQESV